MRGIDVSAWNGAVDWQAVKAAGMDFVICRTGYGKSYIDKTFQKNVEGAHAAGLICGAYHYSYALTNSHAAQEAIFCKSIIEDSGVFLDLPVFFDMEDGDGYKFKHGFYFTRRNVTEICKTFLDYIEPLNCGIYASLSWLEDYIDWKNLDCPVWSAQYNRYDDFGGMIWQFTDKLDIGGKQFDGNILYDEVDKLIKRPRRR